MRILGKLSAREVLIRPGRAVLTLLSVVIGVAAVVGVSIATTTTRHSFQDMYRAVTGEAALEITSASGQGFDADVVAGVADVSGVEVVSPVVQRPTIMYFHDRRVQLTALGIDPASDPTARNYEIVAGQLFKDGEGIVLDADFANWLGLRLHETVKVRTRRGLSDMEITGLARPRGAGAVSQAGLLLMPLREAQRGFDARGEVDRVFLVLDDSADEQRVQDAVAALLPAGIVVRQPATRSQQALELVMGLETALLLALVFAFLASVFIILNTFLMNIGQRRRQLAIMRTIGATRGQIAGMLYREALVLGLVGTAIGILVGLAAAYFLTRSMEQLLQTPLPALDVTPLPFILAFSFGVGVSLVGALFPAWRASRLSPLEAMRDMTAGQSKGTAAALAAVGIVLLCLTGATFAACYAGWLAVDNSVWAALAGLLGCVLLLPAVADPLSRLLVKFVPPRWRAEARLAQRQLVRNQTRTALTAGVLFVAASTSIGLANSVIDNVNDVKGWYRKAIVGDFFVRAMMPDVASGDAADLPPEVGDEIRAIEGVTRVSPVRFVQANAAGESVIVVVRDFPTDEDVNFDVADLNAHDLRQRLEQGEVVLGSVLAQRTGLGAGDRITLETPDGAKQLLIAATANDYLAGGLTLHMAAAPAERLLGVQGVDAYVVKAETESLPAVHAALADLCERHGLLLQSWGELIALIDMRMAGVVGGLWVMLALGLVVASLGVVNTLTMNVLEQTREIGLLRVVAMTRRQVRRSVLAQAALLGLIALPPGIVAGVGFAYLINVSTLSVVGHTVAFSISPLLLIGGLFAALTIVVFAAWFPARRAARLDLLTSLHYE